MKVELYLTPVPFAKATLEDKIVVVIDVLRSSTSICQALASGAKAVIPADGRGEAGDLWAKIGSDTAILAGEQNGVKFENFQLGNSPLEFTPETVGGKFVIMATTNGTGVFKKAHHAAKILSCALVNISAVAEHLKHESKDLVIVCSGREGHFSIEDTICGGMLISKLQQATNSLLPLNDAGKLALLLFEKNQHHLIDSIKEGEHSRFLESIGFDDDVTFSVTVDKVPVLPVIRDGKLVVESES